MQKVYLKLDEIKKNIGLNIDPMGFLFNYDNRIFRAINNEEKDGVLYLFNSGAIDELNRANLIPHTKISEVQLEGFDLVLEHEKIDVVIYPTEWSFNMLKDAALLVIEINKILSKYNFETRDTHGYNVMFHHSKPKYVDIGSFGKKTTKKYWAGKDNFREFYFYSLYMWSKGNSVLTKQLLINDGKYHNTKDYEFFIYRYAVARLLPQKFLERLFYYLRLLRNLQKFKVNEILIVKKEKQKRKLLKILMNLSKAGIIPNNNTNFEKLERRIKRFNHPALSTEWGEYHSNLSEQEIFEEGSRFQLIIERVKKLNIESVLEIAGNQGLLAEELSNTVTTVTCSDIDERAVDFMYLRAKNRAANIYPVILDFLSPVYQNLYYAETNSVFKRYKADVVLALALTHHLILTRKTPIDSIFEALAMYTNKYLFVEFMPLGLRRGKVPDWYTIDWFREHFVKYFESIEELTTEKDGSRILFIGKKRL
ncbi:MAG: hypothetical protein IPM14_05550 [bacterium]|nr:hypothetical protein [bacterium]